MVGGGVPVICHAVVPGRRFSATTADDCTPSGPSEMAGTVVVVLCPPVVRTWWCTAWRGGEAVELVAIKPPTPPTTTTTTAAATSDRTRPRRPWRSLHHFLGDRRTDT